MRWQSVLAIVILSASVSSAQCASKQSQTNLPSTMPGLTVVVQDASGAVARNSWVRVQHWSGYGADNKLIVDAEGRTDSTGAFHLELPGQGIYEVFASGQSFIPASTFCEVHKGRTIHFVLRLGIMSGSGQMWE
jgi:hypothetical protein